MKQSRSKNHPYPLFTISEVAWILGVDVDRVCWAIRVGLLPVVRRRKCLLVPAYVLAELAAEDDPHTDRPGQGGGAR
jgi:hypothetical protein